MPLPPTGSRACAVPASAPALAPVITDGMMPRLMNALAMPTSMTTRAPPPEYEMPMVFRSTAGVGWSLRRIGSPTRCLRLTVLTLRRVQELASAANHLGSASGAARVCQDHIAGFFADHVNWCDDKEAGN